MTDIRCQACGRDLHPVTAAVCEHCRHTLEVALVNIGYYHADLTTLRTGQTHYSHASGVTARGDSHLGMDTRWGPTAVDGKLKRGVGDALAHEVRNTITSWARVVLEENTPFNEGSHRGPMCETCDHISCTLIRGACTVCIHRSCSKIRKHRHPPDTVTGCCRYLLGWSDWLRLSEGGHDALRELTALEVRLARMVDRPPDQWYAGVCSAPLNIPGPVKIDCPEHLYARAESGDIKCRSCGKVHDIGERRLVLLSAAENVMLSATECARAITVLGEYGDDSSKLAARISKWSQRGKISLADKSVGEASGRPTVLYRVGAVLDLLAADLRHDGKRKVSA